MDLRCKPAVGETADASSGSGTGPLTSDSPVDVSVPKAIQRKFHAKMKINLSVFEARVPFSFGDFGIICGEIGGDK